MNESRLVQLVSQFHKELDASEELQSHVADHQQRSERAQRLLTGERIPQLTADELRELFFDSDAFNFWKDKEWEFNDRVQTIGLEGLRRALLELITRAECGLTATDLKEIWQMRGLGVLLSTEFLAYRFPMRYWTYSEKVSLPAFARLGDDLRTRMPRGEKSNPYFYFALAPLMASVRAALAADGFEHTDNLTADIFLWWVNHNVSAESDNEALNSETSTNGSPMTQRVWLFQANPKYYDLAAALEKAQVGNTDAWNVSRFRTEMQVGDVVLLWQSGKDAGLYAIAELTGEPYQRDWKPTKKELREKPFVKNEWWVDLKYTKLLSEPILRETLKTHPVLGKMEIFRFAQSSNFRVLPEEWSAVQELLQNVQVKTSDRESEDYARQVMERLVPDTAQRRQILGVLADYIIQAHAQGTSRWGITLFPNRIRLNVGKIQVLVISAETLYLVMDAAALSSADRTVLKQAGEIPNQVYDSVPRTTDVMVAAENLSTVAPVIDKGYKRLVERAAKTSKRTPWYKSHSSGVIKYLAHTLGRAIPQPDYGTNGAAPASPESIAVYPVLDGALRAQGYHFTQWQIATFYTALQTKGFVILSGISGTGKTKLAQYFAALLPQPNVGLLEPSDDLIALTVQPYMLKYNRLIIPKKATRLLDLAPGKHREVQIAFGGQAQLCRLVHSKYDNTDYFTILLRGKARLKFPKHFQVDDTLYLEPELDDDQNLTGFRLLSAQEATSASKTGKEGQNWLFLPVRPDWRDGKSLLGYYNPLTNTYEETDLLRFILRARDSYRQQDGLAWFVILDEMNLAHVEYYFADFLSVLESGYTEDGYTREPLRLAHPEDADGNMPPAEIYLPANLYVIGTVNIDETTHAFSPKVLDRAFTLELTEADFTDYLVSTQAASELAPQVRQALHENFTFDGAFVLARTAFKARILAYLDAHPQTRAQLQVLNTMLYPTDLHFGYRVFDEIILFLDAADSNGLFDSESPEEALDAAVRMKVLPKFHGSRGRLEAPLRAVLAWCVDPDSPAEEAVDDALDRVEESAEPGEKLAQLAYRFPKTAERVIRMLQRLYADGFAAFG